MGLVADLIASSRTLTEDTLHRVRKIELRLGLDADLLPGYRAAEKEDPDAQGEDVDDGRPADDGGGARVADVVGGGDAVR